MNTPKVGQILIPNQDYIESNPEIIEAFPNIVKGKEYEILEVIIDVDDMWGITKLKDLSNDSLISLEDAPSLSGYWTLFMQDDSIRVVDPS